MPPPGDLALSAQRSIVGRLEALLLLGMGLGALALASSDRYTVLMHPSFRWVTLAGAVLLVPMGLVLLRHPRKAPPLGTWLTFLAFFGALALTRPLRDTESVLAPAGPPAATLEREGYERLDPQGIFHAFDEEKTDLGGRRVVMGGLVKRTPELDAAGRFALLDPVMTCCIADAVALGILVDRGGVAAPNDGEWIYVYGDVVDPPEAFEVPALRTGRILFTTLSRRYRLEAHDLLAHRALMEDVVEKIPEDRCAEFLAALEATGLSQELRAEGPFTLFVPLDASFDAPPDTAEDPLRRYLEGFVARGRLPRKDLYDLETVTTLSGKVLDVRVENGRLRIHGARILFSDPAARNGAIHLIHPAWKD